MLTTSLRVDGKRVAVYGADIMYRDTFENRKGTIQDGDEWCAKCQEKAKNLSHIFFSVKRIEYSATWFCAACFCYKHIGQIGGVLRSNEAPSS